MRKSMMRPAWLLSGLVAAAMLAACGGGGGGGGGGSAGGASVATNSGAAPTSSVVPASWVGKWASVNWVNGDGTCDASYDKSSSAGGGTYYGAGFNSLLTITSAGVATNVESLYNDNRCTSLAGTITTTFQLSNVQAAPQTGYSDVDTLVGTITGSSTSASGGTGLSLASLPASSGTVQLRFGLNGTGELCSGHGTNDANGYPTFSGFYPPDLCSIKQ